MSTLTFKEESIIERALGMSTGYVLEFDNREFARFFNDFDVNIYSEKYEDRGTSKANHLRVFLEKEDDLLVGKVLEALLKIIENDNTSPDNLSVEQIDTICKRLVATRSINTDDIHAHAKTLNDQNLSNQIIRINNSIDQDPCLAIGAAKELIETCCKSILRHLKIVTDDKPNITKLTKTTLQHLNLLPEQHSGKKKYDNIKNTLQSLSSIVHNVDEIRAEYGTGHGSDATSPRLQSRHAKLVAGSAITLVNFLYDTYKLQTEG